MNKIDPYYVSAYNFFCFGPEGIELDFRNYEKIVTLNGTNLDVVDESGKPGSNAVGKSTIPNIIVYTFFGHTINENLGHADIIHNKIGKNLRTEVRWGKWRIVRKRKPDGLQLWENEEGIWDKNSEITQGTTPLTQALIIKKLGGISFETLVNTIFFSDDHKASFLESKPELKRQIVENLLSLGPYRQYLEKAKELKKECNKNIEYFAKEFERSTTELELIEKRIVKVSVQEQEWKINKQNELDQIKNNIATLKLKLEQTDIGTALSVYHDAQDKISKYNISASKSEEILSKIIFILQELEDKITSFTIEKNEHEQLIHKLTLDFRKIISNIDKNKEIINKFESKKGTKCPQCLGDVKEENFKSIVDEAKKQMNLDISNSEEISESIRSEKVELDHCCSKLKLHQSNRSAAIQKSKEVSEKINVNRKEIAILSKINKPEAGADEKIIEARIDESNKQILSRSIELEGDSPFKSILEMIKQECLQKSEEVVLKKQQVHKQETELPYFDFWVKAFGDNGIRKFVIDGILPTLNDRTAYWLQYLMSNKFSLVFDNELNEKITRNPDDGSEFVFQAMSMGQRQRLRLALSQAFAHVMILNSGIDLSVVFLDEVSSNVDEVGVEAIYRMIQELSRTKKVFVTTHDRTLKELLAGCDSINLVLKDGFTTLQK